MASAKRQRRWGKIGIHLLLVPFLVFSLFLSIGGNLYLGWTAAEFYGRYRLAVDRLRTAGRA